MACDSLYVAWLKIHYPYELYVTMLKLYDEKKNMDKISAIISEMQRYKGISMISGSFGQDNRDWLVDKDASTISQSLSSIRYLNKDAAEDLYMLGQKEEAVMGIETVQAVLKPEIKKSIAKIKKRLKTLKEIYLTEEDPMMSVKEIEDLHNKKQEAYTEGVGLEQGLNHIMEDQSSYESLQQEIEHTAKLDCFTNVLRAIQMNTRVKTNQLKVLIDIGYFRKFGKTDKLNRIYNAFFEGENKLTKTIKSFNQRLETIREFEASLPDEDLPVGYRLQSELENIGLCLTTDAEAPNGTYFVLNMEDKYGVKATLYNVQRGTTGRVRVARKDFERAMFQQGQLIRIQKYDNRPRRIFRNGESTIVPGETECWLTKYSVCYPARPAARMAG